MIDEEVLNGSDGEAAAEDVGQNGDASPGKKTNGVDEKGLAAAERIKIKGKRTIRGLTKEVSAAVGGVVNPVRKWKNSRRSRSGFSRGAPKKGKFRDGVSVVMCVVFV